LPRERSAKGVTALARVFLLEDHSWFRKALADLLGRQPDLEVIGEAGSLAEARREAAEKAERIDLAVVDLLLPDGIGTELIRDLRTNGSGVPVLVLTVAQGPDLRAWVLSMGADEIISKDASVDEILAAIRVLLRGRG
jgi:DNA-binding NarL/FixJ family response regulator